MNTEPAEVYSFERAFEEDAFLQLPLLSWEQFGRQAKERDVSLSFGSNLRDRLEDLDRTGALRPVAFVVPGAPGFDEYVFREGVEYRPWQDYPRDEPWPQRVLYSHWQLLYVRDAVDLGVANVSADWLLHEPRDMSEVFREWHEMRLEQRAGLDVSWRSLLLLLTGCSHGTTRWYAGRSRRSRRRSPSIETQAESWTLTGGQWRPSTRRRQSGDAG